MKLWDTETGGRVLDEGRGEEGKGKGVEKKGGEREDSVTFVFGGHVD